MTLIRHLHERAHFHFIAKSDQQNLVMAIKKVTLLVARAIIIYDLPSLQFSKYPDTIGRYKQTPLSFSLSPTVVEFGRNVTVSWAIPMDEATHKDWIGRYTALYSVTPLMLYTMYIRMLLLCKSGAVPCI